jgi:hypothetical protein
MSTRLNRSLPHAFFGLMMMALVGCIPVGPQQPTVVVIPAPGPVSGPTTGLESPPAKRVTEITFGPASLLGSGCSAASSDATFTEQILEVKGASIQASAPAPKVRSVSCNLRIPLDVPQGTRLVPQEVVIGGKVSVPRGATGSLQSTLSAGAQSLGTQTRNFTPKDSPNGEATWRVTEIAQPTPIDACKAPVSTVLGLNVSLTARGRGGADGTTASLSAIPSEGVLYRVKFKVEKCS